MKRENQVKERNNSSFLGLLIILFGILLLINNLVPGLYFFNRLFSWPMILIIVGLVIGHKSKYENSASYVLIGVGVFFLILKLFPINLSHTIIWPVILIAIGFTLITNQTKRSRNKRSRENPFSNEPSWDKRVINKDDAPFKEDTIYEEGDLADAKTESIYDQLDEETDDKSAENNSENTYTDNQNHSKSNTRDDYIDSSSIFGSNKINVVSRNFKGGNIMNIFAGTEINFMHADINDSVSLEVIQLFGGCTIIAPAHWVIQSEMGSFFGGIEDKRFTNSMPDHQKVLYIRGTSLFGGITIKSI